MIDFSIRIIRYKKNADFCFNDPEKGPFGNRLKNNYKDTLVIEQYNTEKKRIDTLFACPCQAWANHPDAPADGSWSLSTGTFEVTFFIEQRAFKSPVHGIGKGYTKTGDFISPTSFDVARSGKRYLIHDDRNKKGRDSGGFSQGCIVLPEPMHSALNNFLIETLKVKPGDKAPMGVIEI